MNKEYVVVMERWREVGYLPRLDLLKRNFCSFDVNNTKVIKANVENVFDWHRFFLELVLQKWDKSHVGSAGKKKEEVEREKSGSPMRIL